ncbi:MAG: hypothetical protein IJP30_02800 [Clostridia bacterium]|nr:hypothetical protein [Clostridia bacterium]
MKKHRRFLALFLGLSLIVGCSAQPAAPTPEAVPLTPEPLTRFSADDLQVNGLKYGATFSQAAYVFGEPDENMEDLLWRPGETAQIWSYEEGGLTLIFLEGKLTTASWQGGPYTGPRGITEDSTLAEVRSRFYHEADRGCLYSAGENEEDMLPPYGRLDIDEAEGFSSFFFVMPMQAYTQEEIDSGRYKYAMHAMLEIIIGPGNHVVSVFWNVAPLAE